VNTFSVITVFKTVLERLIAGMWGWTCKKWGWNTGLATGLVMGLASIRKIIIFQ
jgi:hypothetical protein